MVLGSPSILSMTGRQGDVGTGGGEVNPEALGDRVEMVLVMLAVQLL
jgi:hypothetical protein